VALACAASAAVGQCPMPWVQVSSTGPSPRQNHAMAYDPVRNLMVVFGGYGPFPTTVSFNGETWGWNEESWNLLSDTGPAPRGNTALAFDTARGKLVLFGGATPTQADDTWEWDGASWTQVFPAVSPPARFNHAMAYDSTRHVVVMTGGFGAIRFSDTWEYDGVTWTERTGIASYGARSSHAMAFDASRDRMVVFGGYNGARLADTKEFDGANWVDIPVAGPSGRQYTGMDYSPDAHVIVLFGGQTGPASTDRQQDTWVYDGAAWTQVASTGPSPRDQHAVAYHSGAHKFFVFGGYEGGNIRDNDTWVAACIGTPPCYGNCDGSTTEPVLNVLDFNCFLNRFGAGESYANCDGSTIAPVLNVLDFNCFLNRFSGGCP
jgi:hypothetical protein